MNIKYVLIFILTKLINKIDAKITDWGSEKEGYKLDLLGIISTVGGNIIEHTYKYNSIEPVKKWFSLNMGIGQLELSRILAKRSTGILGRLMSPGRRVEARESIGFLEESNFKYVGLLSGSRSIVRNALFQMLIEDKFEEVQNNNNNITRNVTIYELTISEKHENDIKSNIKIYEMRSILLSMFSSLIQIIGIVLNIIQEEWITTSILIIGSISSMISAFASSQGNLSIGGSGKPTKNSPKGDGIIYSEQHPNCIILLKANEITVRKLIQDPINVKYDKKNEIMDEIATLVLLLSGLLTLLGTPAASLFGQISIGIVAGIGTFTNMIIAHRKTGYIADIALKKHIDYNWKLCKSFDSWTKAISFCLISTKKNTKENTSVTDLIGLLLPNSLTWRYWAYTIDDINKNNINKDQINEELLKYINEEYEKVYNDENNEIDENVKNLDINKT